MLRHQVERVREGRTLSSSRTTNIFRRKGASRSHGACAIGLRCPDLSRKRRPLVRPRGSGLSGISCDAPRVVMNDPSLRTRPRQAVRPGQREARPCWSDDISVVGQARRPKIRPHRAESAVARQRLKRSSLERPYRPNLDLIEANEAFAAQACASTRESRTATIAACQRHARTRRDAAIRPVVRSASARAW